jgi:hypothetical protein
LGSFGLKGVNKAWSKRARSTGLQTIRTQISSRSGICSLMTEGVSSWANTQLWRRASTNLKMGNYHGPVNRWHMQKLNLEESTSTFSMLTLSPPGSKMARSQWKSSL